MPRNQPKPLSAREAKRAFAIREQLAEGERVTLDYTKRDGTPSESTGEVRFFSGADGMDTMSVTIDTSEKGPRTINLCRVTKVIKL